MSAFRATLLLLTLVSAAAIGWLGERSLAFTVMTSLGRRVDRPAIDPAHSHYHASPRHPGRPQKTRPDPTPNDETLPLAGNRDCEGPDSLVQGPIGACAACCPDGPPSLAWYEPVRHAHLFQITRRFRC
jgi:hypothetical protein